MITKTITYEDFNGIKRTEKFHFNLNKSELITNMDGTEADFTSMVQGIIEAKDISSLSRIFKDIILRAYGIKGVDGKSFRKNDEIRETFEGSPAYEQLFIELISDYKKAVAFIIGILPSDIAEEAKKALDDMDETVDTSTDV